jgi:Pyridoxamine 5'-phosphate oxidase
MTHRNVWRDLELGAPEVARVGVDRLDSTRVAFLGTLRRDGSPRISPVETHLVAGHLLVGAMSRSRKADDLRRDPRYTLHSAITDPDAGEPELKISGVATAAGEELRDAAEGAWWSGRPQEEADVFSLQIDHAVLITWDIEHSQMAVHRWSGRHGYERSVRSYP